MPSFKKWRRSSGTRCVTNGKPSVQHDANSSGNSSMLWSTVAMGGRHGERKVIMKIDDPIP
jgi:hypothetical protein